MFSGKQHAQWVKEFFKDETKTRPPAKGGLVFALVWNTKGMQKRRALTAETGKNETVQETCWKQYWTETI